MYNTVYPVPTKQTKSWPTFLNLGRQNFRLVLYGPRIPLFGCNHSHWLADTPTGLISHTDWRFLSSFPRKSRIDHYRWRGGRQAGTN